MSAVFRCADPAGVTAGGDPFLIDAENVLTVVGPGCYRCEEVYRPGAETTRCPGEPTGG